MASGLEDIVNENVDLVWISSFYSVYIFLFRLFNLFNEYTRGKFSLVLFFT